MHESHEDEIEKIELLADALAEQGFEGVDYSPSISLGDYGFMWNPETHDTVWYNEIISNPMFDYGYIRPEDVEEAIEEMEEGFFEYADLNQDVDVQEHGVKHLILSISQYSGRWRHGPWRYNLDEMVEKEVPEKVLSEA